MILLHSPQKRRFEISTLPLFVVTNKENLERTKIWERFRISLRVCGLDPLFYLRGSFWVSLGDVLENRHKIF